MIHISYIIYDIQKISEHDASRAKHDLAGRLGIEPRLKASKASVLPLDDLPIKEHIYKIHQKMQKNNDFMLE